MATPIEQVYFTWLCDRVNVNNGKSYDDLLGQLHTKEFVWFIPNDDNRLGDAQDFRYLFVNENGIENPGDLLKGVPPLSVLEVILGLSERLSFLADGGAPDWAWTIIGNLDLHRYSDPITPRKAEIIDDILESLIWRTYEPDGTGGFFPLTHPNENQTKIEIWAQMHSYLNELEH